MSWYKGRINFYLNKLNETGLGENSSVQDTVTICFTVTDMSNENDYEIIKKQLLKLHGIVDLMPYHAPKKLCVNFDPKLVGLQHIVYEISQLGYHYINRG